MSRFLRTLAKVGLLELDPREAAAAEAREPGAGLDEQRLERILAEEEAAQKSRALEARGSAREHSSAGPDAATAAPSPLLPSAAGSARGAEGSAAVAEGVSFEAMYEGAEIPASPFPAERLLKLLEGLRAMDANTRKTAILAMDAADDAWTIDDVLLDAERKCRALALGIERVTALSVQVEERVRTELAAVDQYAEQASATIRRQIAELEKLLQEELEKAAARRAELQMEARSAAEGAGRERQRYEREIARLREIAQIFAPPPEALSPSKKDA